MLVSLRVRLRGSAALGRVFANDMMNSNRAGESTPGRGRPRFHVNGLKRLPRARAPEEGAEDSARA